jgi:hypothetical protein
MRDQMLEYGSKIFGNIKELLFVTRHPVEDENLEIAHDLSGGINFLDLLL